ncbi:MAG: thermonuclease family protein [Burkholderiaceae bacterium]|nr:thermonuclease family protein [Burkholderiaceae bacterium]
MAHARAEARATPTVSWIAGVVAYVYDGDSFRLRTADGDEIGVRIAGIDAPERTQPFANVARKALQQAIGAREVRVEAIKRDAFGRTVGRVFVAGHDVGLGQLEQGLAWHFVRYDADLPPAERERYARAQANAREQRAGLWQQSEPLAPWLFRRQRR